MPAGRLRLSAPGIGRQADLDDLQLADAARDLDLDLIPDLLANEALADRSRDRDLVLVRIFLAGADEDIVFLLVEVEVEDGDLESVGGAVG